MPLYVSSLLKVALLNSNLSQHGEFRMLGIGQDYLLSVGVSIYYPGVSLVLIVLVVLVIYVDSIFFASGTAILSNGFGIDSSASICTKALLLCLSCYVRAYLIPRPQSELVL